MVPTTIAACVQGLSALACRSVGWSVVGRSRARQRNVPIKLLVLSVRDTTNMSSSSSSATTIKRLLHAFVTSGGLDGDGDDDEGPSALVHACMAAACGDVAGVNARASSLCAMDVFAVITIAVDSSARDVVVHLLAARPLLSSEQLTALLFGAVRTNDLSTARELIHLGADSARVLAATPVLLPRMRTLLETTFPPTAALLTLSSERQRAASLNPVLDVLKPSAQQDYTRLARQQGLLEKTSTGRTLLVFAASSPSTTPFSVEQRTFFVLNASRDMAPETYTSARRGENEKIAYRFDDVLKKTETQETFRVFSIVATQDGRVYKITEIGLSESVERFGQRRTVNARKSVVSFRIFGEPVAASDGFVLLLDTDVSPAAF